MAAQWNLIWHGAGRLRLGIIRTTLLALLASGLASGQAPGVYLIDPKASRIEIRVFRAGILGGLGDDHVIVLSRFSGTAVGSQGKLWEVRVRADSGSLKVTDPNLSDSSRQEVERTMLGPSQLDVARFPSIELHSKSLLPGDPPENWRMLADLTLHGVTRRTEFPVNWSESRGRLRVQGKARLFLRDFKIEPIRKFLGTVQVRNDFEVVYNVTLARQP